MNFSQVRQKGYLLSPLLMCLTKGLKNLRLDELRKSSEHSALRTYKGHANIQHYQGYELSLHHACRQIL